jgi:DNA repair photolyase
MDDNDFGTSAIWTEDRVFLAPSVGCPAKCRFCYLGSDQALDRSAADLTPEALVGSLCENVAFRAGPEGTVISLGCLGEPLAPHAVTTTIRVLELLRDYDNPVQVATRWVLVGDDFLRFIQSTSVLNIAVYHSLSTVHGVSEIEVGTPRLENRREFMAACTERGIPSVLYIKPFLPGIP